MKVNMRHDLRSAMSVVLDDVVVCLVDGDIGKHGPEDAACYQREEAAEFGGGSAVQVGDFDVVVSGGDEDVASG